MTLGLKFLLCLSGHFFNSKKTLFMYYGFSVATNVYCEVVGKSVCITRMGAGRNYSYNKTQS